MPVLTDIFTNIANAIRSKNGLENTYTPAEMAQAIEEIPTGSSETETVLWENSSPNNNYGTRKKTTQMNLSSGFADFTKLRIYYKCYKTDANDRITSVTFDISNLSEYLVPTAKKTKSYFNIAICATLNNVTSVNFMVRNMYLPSYSNNAIICDACYRLDYYDSSTDYCDYCIPIKICGIN